MDQKARSPGDPERAALSRRDVLKLSAMVLLFAACRPRYEAPSPVSQLVAAGENFSLAIRDRGMVWAWGYNPYDTLGDGRQLAQTTPIQVAGLANVIQIAAAHYHSMALRADGTVWAWGNNDWGQIGDGTTTIRLSAVQVPALTEITSVVATSCGSAALKNDGTVWAWGRNSHGWLGETSEIRTSPFQMPDLAHITAITLGTPALALDSNGAVWDWGGYRLVSLRTLESTYGCTPPDQVTRLPRIVSIASGEVFGMAIDDTGTVWAWGYNDHGQLGIGTVSVFPPFMSTPTQVLNLANVIAISCGHYHTLALADDGSVWSWGLNLDGRLGNGTEIDSAVPIRVPSLRNVVAISAGYSHSLALQSDGTVWAWGRNLGGEIGDGTTEPRYEPVQVRGLP